jgi:hypothetical protein
MEEQLTREKNPNFYKLFDLINVKTWREENKGKKSFSDYQIYAKTTKDVTMSVWNGNHHPSIEANCKEHICKSGTRVRVWMVSRMGDAGITDNLINPIGYNARGLDADVDLIDYEFIENLKK